MPRKTLRVQVELDIQAVTCPGVWLCPNGKVSLQVFILDSCINTTGLQPVFPLLYHEKFVFYKNFHSACSLSELHKLMSKEFLYAELIQWQNCDTGNVIASFQSSLCDVLYPSTSEGAIAGVDVDLLMEPSKHFPGIISPKIEISTRTTVEEILCADDQRKLNSFVLNPKTILSDQCPCGPKHKVTRQQKVCHSVGYHNRARRCSKVRKSVKPPFVYRKAEAELLGRKPQGFIADGPTKKCNCCLYCQNASMLFDDKKGLYSSPLSVKPYRKIAEETYNPKSAHLKRKGSKKSKMCSCGSGHVQENCPLCAKYRYYFEGGACSCSSPTRMAGGGQRRSLLKDNYARKITTSSPMRDHDKYSSRSPVKIVGREWCSSVKPIQCAYSPSRTTFNSGGPGKACDCAPLSNDDKSSRRTCCCSSSPKKPSLAEQIHYRLMKTLDCAPAYPFVPCTHEPNSGSESLCSCPKFRNCKEGFYKNLGKFYRDLRRC